MRESRDRAFDEITFLREMNRRSNLPLGAMGHQRTFDFGANLEATTATRAMMHNLSMLLLAFTVLLVVCCGLDAPATDASAAEVPADASSEFQAPNASSSKVNATIAGNNLLVTHSNIFVISGGDRKSMVDFIKRMVMKGSSPQDDDALTTQIITVLGAGNHTTSDIAAKMMPKIRKAFQSRAKPKQLNQAIVKLTEMSPRFVSNEADNHDA